MSRFTDVDVSFSESVRRVNSQTFTLTSSRTGSTVDAEVFRNGSSRHWVLDPERRLSRHTRYIVELEGHRFGISDLDGNRLFDRTWSFRTGRR